MRYGEERLNTLRGLMENGGALSEDALEALRARAAAVGPGQAVPLSREEVLAVIDALEALRHGSDLEDDGLMVTSGDDGYYGEFRKWEPDVPGANFITMRPLLAEAIGAGVVAAGSSKCWWAGGGGKPRFDVVGDGVRCNVKAAWYHSASVLGIPPPPRLTEDQLAMDPRPRRGYNPELVDEITLVVLPHENEEVAHRYFGDGTVVLRGRARAAAIYRVPVETMNQVMRPDGRSTGRWLVDLGDIEQLQVRA